MASKTDAAAFSGVYLLMATIAYVGSMIALLTAGCLTQGFVEPAGSWARIAYLGLAILTGPLAASILYFQDPRRGFRTPLASLGCWAAGGLLGAIYFMVSIARS